MKKLMCLAIATSVPYEIDKYNQYNNKGNAIMTQDYTIQSEQIDQLMTALSKAQGEISSASKDSSNTFFKSKYADLCSIWDACRQSLSKHGLAVVQSPMPFNGVLTMVTTLGHSSGQWIRSYLPIISTKQDAHGMGSGITYTRRYALAAIVGVVPDDQEDDDGNKACGKEKEKVPEESKKQDDPKITKEQTDYLTSMVTPEIEEMVKRGLIDKKYQTMSQLKASEFAMCESWIKSLLKGKQNG